MTSRSRHASAACFMIACSHPLAGPRATPPTHTTADSAQLPVEIRVDAASALGPLSRPWRYFGADEPNYATTASGEQLLAAMGALAPGEVYFRAHNLLTSGDGLPALKWGSTNAYTEPDGVPRFDFTLVDAILEAGLRHGVRPLVEIGFMPEALSRSPAPYRHDWPRSLFTGWTQPPTDYAKWEELVYRWARHSVDKYGAEEVSRWWWETWNEPNIGYWSGTPEEFFRLNDHALAAVRRALPAARVGGPHTAGDGGEFMERFLEHALRGTNYATGERGTPLDYLAFHAKGGVEWVDGHVRMDMGTQLRTIETAFARFSRYPELAGKPVIIGESDPESCAACTDKQYEYRNGPAYASYTAAVFPRKLELAERHGIQLEGAVTWAFTFDGQPPFAGFRQVASNGVPMAVFNAFRMFAKLGPERVVAQSSAQLPLAELLAHGARERADVGVLASRGPAGVSILIWHHHDEVTAGPPAHVRLTVSGLPRELATVSSAQYRIDEDHSNAHAAWRHLGSPPRPTAAEQAQLQRASELQLLEARTLPVQAGEAELELTLPRHGVSLVLLEAQVGGA